MHEPYDRVVLAELLGVAGLRKSARFEDVVHTRSVALDGGGGGGGGGSPAKTRAVATPVQLERAARSHPGPHQSPCCIVDTQSGKEWQAPRAGRLDFAYREERSPPPADGPELAGPVHVARLLRIVNAQPTPRGRRELLALVCADLALAQCQAQVVLDSCAENRATLMACLLPCVVQFDDLFEFVNGNLAPADVAKVVVRMGEAPFRFNAGNPTGRWQLNLGSEAHVRLGMRFAAIDQAGANAGRRSGCGDVSQNGNWSGFRNLKLNHAPLAAGATRDPSDLQAFFSALPSAGLLEFDFVGCSRPPPAAEPVSQAVVADALRRIGITPRLMCGLGEPDSISAGGVAGGERARAAVPPPQSVLSLHFHVFASSHWFSCRQLVQVLEQIPDLMVGVKVEVALSTFSRLIDLENFGSVVAALPRRCFQELVERLGYLAFVNPVMAFFPHYTIQV
jgi:hypothetical protein